MSLHGPAYGAAGDSVSARVEGGAGDHNVRPIGTDQTDDFCGGLFYPFRKKIIAAGDGRHHFTPPFQGILKSPSGSGGTFGHPGACTGLFLAPDTAEKLIQVMNDSQDYDLPFRK
jgi:hypothetical protein